MVRQLLETSPCGARIGVQTALLGQASSNPHSSLLYRTGLLEAMTPNPYQEGARASVWREKKKLC